MIYPDRKRRPKITVKTRLLQGLICALSSRGSNEMATCLDSVIWRDFQQPEHSTAAGALTSMQLPHRTVSFIMKGLKQAPTQQDIHTRAHTQSELRVASDKQQSGRSQHNLRILDGLPHVSTRHDLHRRSKRSEQLKKKTKQIIFFSSWLEYLFLSFFFSFYPPSFHFEQQ